MVCEIGNLIISISESALKMLKSQLPQNGSVVENGGILLGRVFGSYIHITDVSAPGKGDKRKPFGFIRSIKNANKRIRREFKESSGRTIYLGEWHCHPEDNPIPSSQDMEMIREQFVNNELNEPFVLLFIIGWSNLFVGMFDGRHLYRTSIEV